MRALCASITVILMSGTATAETQPISVRLSPSVAARSLDGRLLLLISKDASAEPRLQINDGPSTQQAFGIDVEGWRASEAKSFDASVLGYPLESLRDVAPGEYTVQALLHKYETFRRADGHVLKLPMDRGEGQQWNRAPGNLYSTPRKVTLDPGKPQTVTISLDKIIPPIVPPRDTKYIKHIKMQSKLLSDFWGRPMYLGAHVLLPEGFDSHPSARYPLVINHGHFPADFGGFRETPPDPNLKPEYSSRFKLAGYNRIVQEHAYKFYQEWTGPSFPRM